MDERRIDGIARLLATGVARRRLAGGLAAALLGGLTLPAAGRAACQAVGQPCGRKYGCCVGARCQGGRCQCKQGWDECAGGCYRLTSDERRCGACDRACAGDQTCLGGACVGADGDIDIGSGIESQPGGP